MSVFVLFATLSFVVASVESTVSSNASASESLIEVPTATEPSFKFGTPTFFGSGCPADTVTVVPSTDGQTVSVLFSQFSARTSGADVTRDRKSCNLAVPVDVQSVSVGGSIAAWLVHRLTVYFLLWYVCQGVSIGIFRVDYRGNAFVRTKAARTDSSMPNTTSPDSEAPWPPRSTHQERTKTCSFRTRSE